MSQVRSAPPSGPSGTVRRPRARARKGEGHRLRRELLDAARDLLAQSGDVNQLSVRAVAAACGVTAPSLYRHFADKEAIVQGLIDRLLRAREIEPPERGGDVAEWLRDVFVALRTELITHPQMLPLVRDSAALLKQSIEFTDVVLHAFEIAGMDVTRRGPAFHALTAFTIGCTEAGSGPTGSRM